MERVQHDNKQGMTEDWNTQRGNQETGDRKETWLGREATQNTDTDLSETGSTPTELTDTVQREHKERDNLGDVGAGTEIQTRH